MDFLGDGIVLDVAPGDQVPASLMSGLNIQKNVLKYFLLKLYIDFTGMILAMFRCTPVNN